MTPPDSNPRQGTSSGQPNGPGNDATNPARPSCLLSFDFDGTLILPPEIPSPPECFRRALTSLRQRGAAWCLNTGRSLAYALEGLEQANLLQGELAPDYLLLREQEIWQPDGQGHWRDCGEWNQRGRQAFADWHGQHQPVLNEIRAEWEALNCGHWIADEHDPVGLQGSTPDAIEAFIPRLHQWRDQHPQLSWQRNHIWLRFCVRGYDKGEILAELARHLQVPRERIFAIGDNFNDLEMLHPNIAGTFACPGNAIAQVRERVAQAGGWTLNTPASYAVAEALDRLLEEGW